MHIIYDLASSPRLSPPLVLTIGNFDGFHLGHQAVLGRLQELSQQLKASTALITFSNHPSTVLVPERPLELISSSLQKLQLLGQQRLDLLLNLPFNQSLSQLSARGFLLAVRERLPFTHLILGHDASIGYKREGTPALMKQLAQEFGFSLEYLSPACLGTTTVSSTAVRQWIRQGDWQQVKAALGRPYSIIGTVVSGKGQGRQLGYPTLNISVDGLVLPPLGVYVVDLMAADGPRRGVANLGVAPTIHNQRKPLLEVHLLDSCKPPAEAVVEVALLEYLRPEQQFSSPQTLREQIAADIAQATRN